MFLRFCPCRALMGMLIVFIPRVSLRLPWAMRLCPFRAFLCAYAPSGCISKHLTDEPKISVEIFGICGRILIRFAQDVGPQKTGLARRLAFFYLTDGADLHRWAQMARVFLSHRWRRSMQMGTDGSHSSRFLSRRWRRSTQMVTDGSHGSRFFIPQMAQIYADGHRWLAGSRFFIPQMAQIYADGHRWLAWLAFLSRRWRRSTQMGTDGSQARVFLSHRWRRSTQMGTDGSHRVFFIPQMAQIYADGHRWLA